MFDEQVVIDAESRTNVCDMQILNSAPMMWTGPQSYVFFRLLFRPILSGELVKKRALTAVNDERYYFGVVFESFQIVVRSI
jgi:hypothetical protein